jgi:hypothetical protein
VPYGEKSLFRAAQRRLMLGRRSGKGLRREVGTAGHRIDHPANWRAEEAWRRTDPRGSLGIGLGIATEPRHRRKLGETGGRRRFLSFWGYQVRILPLITPQEKDLEGTSEHSRGSDYDTAVGE